MARRVYEAGGLSVLAVRRNDYPDDDAVIIGLDLGETPWIRDRITHR